MRCCGTAWHSDYFPEDTTVKLRTAGEGEVLAPARKRSEEEKAPGERRACMKPKDERTWGECEELKICTEEIQGKYVVYTIKRTEPQVLNWRRESACFLLSWFSRVAASFGLLDLSVSEKDSPLCLLMPRPIIMRCPFPYFLAEHSISILLILILSNINIVVTPFWLVYHFLSFHVNHSISFCLKYIYKQLTIIFLIEV